MDTGTVNLYNPELETTEYGQVLQRIVRKDGFSQNIIENYNNEISILKKTIEKTSIELLNGNITFKNVTFNKPKIECGGQKVIMTPKDARSKIQPYFSEITADVTFTTRPVVIEGKLVHSEFRDPEEVKDMPIGYIPVMLGSDLCSLSGKSMTEKMEMGECFNDPLGYFIIQSERVIINQEMLRLSTFMIYQEKVKVKAKDAEKTIENVVGKITCPTSLGTSQNKLIINKNGAIIVYLAHLDKKKRPFPPLFAVFKLLGVDLDNAIELILSFIDEEYREAAFYKMASTIAEYNSLVEGNDDLETLQNKMLVRFRDIDINASLESVTTRVRNDLFTNIQTDESKLLHLAMYSAWMFEYLIGARELDDRDSYSNKKIETPGTKLTQLYKAIWSEVVEYVKDKAMDSKSLREITHFIHANDIKSSVQSAFGPNAWGTKKMRKKDNITETLKRDSPLAIFSQIGKVNVKANRRIPSPKVRMPHGSQLGYIDPYDTPDGEACGLIRHMAFTCYISLERDSKPIFDLINSNSTLKKSVFGISERYIGTIPILLNGVITWWCYADKAIPILRNLRSKGLIYKDTCIFHNKRDKCIEIFCDGGRPTRPLFVVNENCELIIDKKNMWNADVEELIQEGCIEYVDAREQEWIYLAEMVSYVQQRNYLLEQLKKETDPEKIDSVKDMLMEFVPYTHCEIDPTAMFGISANLVPQANRQAGPRTQYQCGMNKQALTQYHSNEHIRFDASYKMLHFPTKPLFQNDLQDTAGLNLMPNGLTAFVAIMAHPDNPEDGIILKEESVKYANKFDMAKKMTTISKVCTSKQTDFSEIFAKPPTRVDEPQGRYSAVNENGIPRLDAYIRPDDCIIGKIRIHNKNSGSSMAGQTESVPERAGVGEEGYIDRVLITKNICSQENIVKVRIRQNRKYIPGDKMALRYSQKGTVSRVLPARMMPRVASGPLKGMVPDIIINPHSLPSRMTINMMIEILTSKAATITGKYVNATTFRPFEEDLKMAQDTLEEYGLDRSGKEDFELPDGTKLKMKCYFGPCHYQALRHHVVDKIQMRARGGIKPSTRQPVSGRSNEGGLKFGEMERDALISHGASALLRERLCDITDAYNLPICKCGIIAITNHEQKIYRCPICGPNSEVGVIRIPYVIKLLMFYLNGAGIHMKFKVSELTTEGSRPEEKFLV
jgi:DNA-directed RNA polymerase II subunit RPB2